MRVLFAGDAHGDLGYQSFLILQVKKFQCRFSFQLGDWGFWSHQKSGSDYIRKLDRMLEREEQVQYWLDGNHENHALLRELYGPGGPDHQLDPEGFWIIKDNIRYAPRGHRWTWSGVSFLSCGGAYSIDKDSRREGISWWPEEMITDEDVQHCVEGGPVDVCLFHDVPSQVEIEHHFILAGKPFFTAETNTMLNRIRLGTVVDAVKPKTILSGHYHLRIATKIWIDEQECRVEVLDCNFNPRQAFLPVDLKEDIRA